MQITRKHENACMVLLLILLAFSGTGLNYELLGSSELSPMYLSQDSAYRHFIYIYDGEVISGKWLDSYGDHEKVVYGDFAIDSRILLSSLSRDAFVVGIIGNSTKKFKQVESYRYFNERGAMKGDYLYLRYFNIKYSKIYDGQCVHYLNGSITEIQPIPFSSHGKQLNKIYDNEFSQIYTFIERIKIE